MVGPKWSSRLARSAGYPLMVRGKNSDALLMDSTSVHLLYLVAVWVIPMFVADDIGCDKDREGWVYGLFLSWLGVLVVWLLPPVKHPPPVW